MDRILVCLTAVVLLAGPLRADEPSAPPKGSPPQQVAARVDGDTLRYAIPQPTFIETREKKKVNMDGKIVEVEVASVQIKWVMKDVVAKVKTVEAFDTRGKKIDREKLPQLLKKRTLVLLSSDGQKVDPFFLELIKDGTLVLVLPIPQVKPVFGGKDRPIPIPAAPSKDRKP